MRVRAAKLEEKGRPHFVAIWRKDVVGDFEKVQYNDVTKTAIERLQAGPQLEW